MYSVIHPKKIKEMDSKIEEVFPTTHNQTSLVPNPSSNTCRSIYAHQTMNTIITKVAQDEPLFSPLDLLNLDYSTSPKSPCNKTNGWTQKNGQETNSYFSMPQNMSMNYVKGDVPSFDSCTYPNQIYHSNQINMGMDMSQNKWMSEVYSELCHLKKILHLQNQQIRDMEQEKNRMAIQLLEQQLSPIKTFQSNLFAFVYERTGVGMCCTLTKDLFQTNTRKEARIMSFNKAFQEILGYDQDFLMSASFRDLVHDVQEFKQTLRKYESEIKKGQKFVCSAKFRHVTGKVIEITSLTDIVLDNSHAFGLHIITKVTPAAV
jgi:PAS domain S-box-containing protein